MVLGARLVTVAGGCRRHLSGSVSLHGRPAGSCTGTGQAMMSCGFQFNYRCTAGQSCYASLGRHLVCNVSWVGQSWKRGGVWHSDVQEKDNLCKSVWKQLSVLSLCWAWLERRWIIIFMFVCTLLVCIQPQWSTQPPTLNRMGSEHQWRGSGGAVWLGKQSTGLTLHHPRGISTCKLVAQDR